MTPKKLRLKGFRGIRDGLGQDELTLNLDSLTGDAQLVSLSGPNGAGKSTLLDNLHPYRIMPSRATGLNPSGFSFYEHLFLPEAEKDLEWSLVDKRYRSRLVFHQNTRRRSEATHYQWRNNGWRPVQLADGTVSDGRTDTYDRCVEAILGKPETFFTAVFGAQNRKPLVSYANAEIKALMVDLLGLEKIQETGEKIRVLLRLLDAQLDKLQQEERTLEHMRTEATVLEGKLQTATRDLDVCAHSVEQTKIQLAAAHQERDRLTELRLRSESSRILRDEINRRVEETQAHAREMRSTLERERVRAVESVNRLSTAQREFEVEVSARSDQLNQSLAEAVERSVQRDDVESAKRSKQLLNAHRHALTETIRGWEADALTRDAINAKIAKSSFRCVQLEAEHARVQQVLADVQSRVALCEIVPCVGTQFHSQCSLLADNRTAAAQLVAFRDQATRLKAFLTEEGSVLDILSQEILPFTDVKEKLTQALAEKEALEHRTQALDALIAQEPFIQAAEGQAEAQRREIAAHTARVQKDRAIREAHFQAARLLVDQCVQQEAELRNKEEVETARLRDELLALPPSVDEGAWSSVQEAVRVRAIKLEQREVVFLQAYGQVASLNAKLQEKHSALEAREKTSQRSNLIRREIEYWAVLAKAFSNDGIVALAIDDVGPAVSSFANDLLMACYGPRFTVSLRTQVSTVKGDLREGFEILVHDAQSRAPKPLGVMSGGERVWIQEALLRGIALYLARQSGCRYETLFSDELDGPLDPERRRVFGTMKREVLKLGGYAREYFVTQSAELALCADVVIDLPALAVNATSCAVRANGEVRDISWFESRAMTIEVAKPIVSDRLGEVATSDLPKETEPEFAPKSPDSDRVPRGHARE